MKKKPAALLLALAAVVGVAAVVVVVRLGLGGELRRAAAPPAGFLRSRADPRVLYEPGGEASAAIVAAALPGAIAGVERALYGPFPGPVRVYVCATVASFAAYTGSRRAGGNTTFGARVFISPKPENTPDRLPRVLTHELTHLHMAQHLGLYRRTRIPVWFGEGLAAWASGGAGAENVSDVDAAHAIRAGRHLEPVGSISLFSRDTPSSYGLDPHMFYRQTGMFVGYLERSDSAAFRLLIRRVEAGERLDRAFLESYRTGLEAAWSGFVRGLGTARATGSGVALLG